MPRALSFKDLEVCHRASLEGDQHLGMPCLFSSLLFLDLGLPLPFSVIKGIGGSVDLSHLKRQQGPAAVTVINLP